MSLRYSANLSILWPALPLAERFQRAAAAGFDAVELWWPGDADAALLPELTRESGLELVLLNFDAGDMQAGDRGLLSDPKRADQFRRNVPRALEIAAACGCRRRCSASRSRAWPVPSSSRSRARTFAGLLSRRRAAARAC